MLNWLNNHFHKHHKFVLGFLLFVMVASFVLYGYIGQPSGPALKRTLYHGVDLASSRETRDARDIAAFASIFNGNATTPAALDNLVKNTLRSGQKTIADPQYAAVLQFVDGIRTADEAGVPQPDDKQIRAFLDAAPWLQENGKFSAKRLQDIATRAREIELDETRLQNVVAQLWRIDKVAAVNTPAAAPDLDVLASRLVGKRNAKWTVETAVFEAAGFKLKSAPDDKALTAYFEKNKPTYRIAEKLRVGVVKVKGTPGPAPLTPSEAELRETVVRHLAEFPETQLLSRDGVPAFLRNNSARIAALIAADKAGDETAVKLTKQLDEVLPRAGTHPDTVKLAATLKAAGLSFTELPAYCAQELPKNTGIPDAQLGGALQLTATNARTVSASGDTAYAFLYLGAVPARDATFAEVRDKVLKDYTTSETRRQFDAAGRTKALDIAAAVKAGKRFADAATAAGLKPSAADTFTYSQPPAKLDALTLLALENVPVGGVSEALNTGTDLQVAHIVSRVDAPATQSASDLARERDELGSRAAKATYGSIVKAENP